VSETTERPGSTASPVPDHGILYKADGLVIEHRNETGYYGVADLWVTVDFGGQRYTSVVPFHNAMDLALKLVDWRAHQIEQVPVKPLPGREHETDHPAPRFVAWTWEHCKGLMALRYELAEDIWDDAVRPVVTNIAQTLRASGSLPPNELQHVPLAP
jgi:hypothetical protein